MPQFAAAQDRPSYATHDEDTIHGRIVSVNGFDVSVRDEKGYVDHVQLHQGTIINPTGLTLNPGMTVTILGFNQGATLAANEIDTPYNYEPAVAYVAPYPPLYYGYYGYGYPYRYGYPYGYGYYGYPSISIGFGFGGYRGFYGRGYYGRGIYGGGYGHGGFGHIGGYNRGASVGGHVSASFSHAGGGGHVR